MEEASGAPVEVWPDNVQAVNVFVAMSTQWNGGMGGPIGLVYGSLLAVLELQQVPSSDRAALFDDLRVLEDAALETMRKNRE